MSLNSQGKRGDSDSSFEGQGVVIAAFPMAPGTAFNWHTHELHQLAWASKGILRISATHATWVLPPTRALWIPAEVPHEVRAAQGATMTAAYLRPDRCSIDWAEPTAVRAGSLLRELIGYLSRPGLERRARTNAESVLVDVLEPVDIATVELRLPTDIRALEVATAFQADPADKRSLAQWGSLVGASERTLARAFLTDTGISFGRWRTMARIQAALERLASGEPVGNVAHSVGYETPSAFVAAFRRQTGQTPGAFSGTG
jgi:AraC-like DNA-binding protein/quercetin dioxygenase-like cupin family protein